MRHDIVWDVRDYSRAARAYLDIRAHTTDVYENEHFRWRDDDDDEANATWLADADNDITFGTTGDRALDTNTRIRFTCNNSAADGFSNGTTTQLRYRIDTGGGFGSWTNVNATSNVVRSSDSTNLTAGNATTAQVAGTGANGFYSTTDNGDTYSKQDDDDGNISGEIDTDYYAEGEYCVQVRSADVSNGDVIELSVLFSTGSTALTSNPSITISTAAPVGSNMLTLLGVG